MNWIDYKAEHAEWILEDGSTKAYSIELAKFFNPQANEIGEGHGFTLIDRGYPILCGGIRPVWNGVGEAWVFTGKRLDDKPIKYCKAFFAKSLDMVKDHKYHRIQASVRKDFETAQRFAKWWGLQKEGLMTGWGPDGSDYFMMARRFMENVK